MKQLVLLFVLSLSGLCANAQQTVNFKINYNHGTVYSQTLEQNVKSEISYGEGMEPMVQEGKTTMMTTTRTGKPVNGQFTFITELSFDKESAAAAALPAGTKLYGKVNKDGSTSIDSVHAPGMDQNTKDMLKGNLKSLTSQLYVPEKKMKVGDSYLVTTPLELPMGPVTMKLDTKTTYKLIKIEGKKAYFDVDQVYQMNTKIEGQNMNASGMGKGDMVYDIEQNFPLQLNTNIDMTMAFEAQGMAMKIKMSSMQKQTTSITSGK